MPGPVVRVGTDYSTLGVQVRKETLLRLRPDDAVRAKGGR